VSIFPCPSPRAAFARGIFLIFLIFLISPIFITAQALVHPTRGLLADDPVSPPPYTPAQVVHIVVSPPFGLGLMGMRQGRGVATVDRGA
jgi:hypothetical protein